MGSGQSVSNIRRKKAFRKTQSETNDSSTLRQRLTKIFKKRKTQQYKISHSSTNGVDLSKEVSNVDVPECDQGSRNDNELQQESVSLAAPEYDSFDFRNCLPTMTENSSDKLNEEGNSEPSGITKVINTNTEEEDGIGPLSAPNEVPRCALEDREKEISRREIEISRREDEMLRTDNIVLTSQCNTIETLNEVTKILGDIVRSPRYVKILRCKNVQVGTTNHDVKQNLADVCFILDGLCEKYEDIKKTTETTLESVKDLQKESTDQSEQLRNLVEYLESELKHHKSVEELKQKPTTSDNLQEQVQSCSYRCNEGCLRPSSNIWGPSTVRDFMVSSHVHLGENVKQILTDVQLLKRNLLPKS